MTAKITEISEEAAVSAALVHDWNKAIRLNSELLKTDSKNIEALNRLGFAYLQSGRLAAAKRTFQKVITFDPYNQIALKNLKKLGTVRQKDLVKNKPQRVSPLMFLEEPGKTKIVECVNAAPAQTLATVAPGQEVQLRTRNHVVEIRTATNMYLGALPDDLSFRLIKLCAGGNRYQCLVKSIGKNSLIVFLREVSRGKRFIHQPSFSPGVAYLSFTHQDRQYDATGDSADEGLKEEQGE